MSRTALTESALLAFSVSVAPISRASSSFEAMVSIAMIRSAPAMAAPLTAERPMPPQPITATVEPGSTLAAWNTAPTPVITPQPTRAARSRGMSSSIFTIAFSCTSNCSPNDDRLKAWFRCCPFQVMRRATPGSILTSVFSHKFGWPVRHCGQVPQNTDRQVAVAQPGKGRAQQHLARPRLVDRDLLDRQRLVRRVKYGGFHRASPQIWPVKLNLYRGERQGSARRAQLRTALDV